jgi:hypothetical protein
VSNRKRQRKEGVSILGGSAEDLTGQRFGSLVAISILPPSGSAHRVWFCLCDCGQTKESYSHRLKIGSNTSCGCQRYAGKGNKKHGLRKTREYESWAAAKSRCFNDTSKRYKDYGGRGITMSPLWKDDFAKFYADMGPRPDGTSLDRENNDDNYEPGNCRWATPIEQANNKRNNVARANA